MSKCVMRLYSRRGKWHATLERDLKDGDYERHQTLLYDTQDGARRRAKKVARLLGWRIVND